MVRRGIAVDRIQARVVHELDLVVLLRQFGDEQDVAASLAVDGRWSMVSSRCQRLLTCLAACR